jgi:hypothetical protein
MWGRGIKEVEEDEGILKNCVGYEKLSLENDGRNGERRLYLACDFNERWLKDSNLLCCIVIVLNVEDRVMYVMKVVYFLKLVFLYFIGQKVKGLTLNNFWSIKLLVALGVVANPWWWE